MKTRSFRLIGRLAALMFMLACQHSARGQRAIPNGSEAELRAEASIYRALDAPFSGQFSEEPLIEVLDAIGRAGNIPMSMDAKTLEDAGVDVNTPVTKAIDKASLRSALGLVLRPLDLSWIIVNESLVITTKERADAELRTVVYPVRDLVTNRRGLLLWTDSDGLIDLITTTIAPTTWDEVGGPGSIAEFRTTKSLVVSQTHEIHEQVAALLAALRKSGDIQGIVPVFSRPANKSASDAENASAERPRYSISPSAAWQFPRTHEAP